MTPTTHDLVEATRAVAVHLHECEVDDDSRIRAMEQLERLADLLSGGPRRLRWYETDDADGVTKVHNRDLSPFSGGLNVMAPPMRLETGRIESGEAAMIGRVRLDRLREGPPSTAHGGVVAGLFDEILAAGQSLTGRAGGVTGRLVVRYRRPTPLDTDLVFRSWIHDDRGHRLLVRADCSVAHGTRPHVTAEAEALFIRRRATHS